MGTSWRRHGEGIIGFELNEMNKALNDDLICSFQRVIYAEYGNDHASPKIDETGRSFEAGLPQQKPKKSKKIREKILWILLLED